jgi:hypothetical protein
MVCARWVHDGVRYVHRVCASTSVPSAHDAVCRPLYVCVCVFVFVCVCVCVCVFVSVPLGGAGEGVGECVGARRRRRRMQAWESCIGGCCRR